MKDRPEKRNEIEAIEMGNIYEKLTNLFDRHLVAEVELPSWECYAV